MYTYNSQEKKASPHFCPVRLVARIADSLSADRGSTPLPDAL